MNKEKEPPKKVQRVKNQVTVPKKQKKKACNKCSFKAKLVETYEGLVGDHVHHRGIYRCFSGHKQDLLLSVEMLGDSPRD